MRANPRMAARTHQLRTFVSGSGGPLVGLFAAASAPQNVVAVPADRRIDPKLPAVSVRYRAMQQVAT
jgi:hypothetical protein